MFHGMSCCTCWLWHGGTSCECLKLPFTHFVLAALRFVPDWSRDDLGRLLRGLL